MSAKPVDKIPEWQPELEQAKKMAENLGWRITPDQFRELRNLYELAETEYKNVIPAEEKLTNSMRYFYTGLYAMLSDVARTQVEAEHESGGVVKELLLERIRRYASDPAYRKELQKSYAGLRELMKENETFRKQGYGIQ